MPLHFPYSVEVLYVFKHPVLMKVGLYWDLLVCRGYRLGDFYLSFAVCMVNRLVSAPVILSIVSLSCNHLLIEYAALSSLYFLG